MAMVADLLNGRLLRLLAMVSLAYAVVVWSAPAPAVILMLTGLATSASGGVCVAYASVFWGALGAARPTKGDFLGAGIFLVSVNILLRCGLSAVARDLGWPAIYNTHWMSGALAVGTIGSLLHVWAPHAVDGRVPRAKWVPTAAVVAIGLFLIFLLWSWHFHSPHPSIELR